MDYEVREAPEAGIEIESYLLRDLRSLLPQAENISVTYAVRDDKGTLVAGISGATSYGWLLVKVLWVHEDHRGQGLGARLLAIAENKARELGCHAAWLDTSNPAAEAFYLRHGYSLFGELENGEGELPEHHRRAFMRKRF